MNKPTTLTGIIDTVRALILMSAIYIIAYIVFTPGTQIGLAVLAGLLIGLYGHSRSFYR